MFINTVEEVVTKSVQGLASELGVDHSAIWTMIIKGR